MRLFCVTVAVVLALACTAVAHADPILVECPYSHAHVWRLDQCPLNPSGPFGGPIGGGGHCGLLCGVGKILGGLGL